ncbi:MAG: ABC transporter permease subunit [Clostridiales bacterium]|nr:ABC transporter permease subunit [Clostridiales bacterium]
MNMFLYELKSLRKSIITWTISMLALAALYLSIYPSMAKDAADFKQLLGEYPEAIRAMLGINLDYISSLLGFYSMIFTFIVLCGAIQAMNLGVSILSKESRERTADFLLVKPVSRTVIVSAKLLAACTALVITNVIFITLSTIMANMAKTEDFSLVTFFMINLSMFFVQIIFLAIGMLISVFFKKLKNVLPVSLGFVFGFYFIGTLLVTDNSEKIKRIFSPFKYFDVYHIIQKNRYEVFYLITGAVIVAISIVVSYIVYNKKDIHAVN